MRRAMICVSVMLAILQLWPMVFGQSHVSVESAAQASKPTLVASRETVPAVATQPAPAVKYAAQVSEPKPQLSCYRRYQAVYAACSSNDGSCRMKAADNWDLCEATGLWPQ